jgi:hypothetical protein
MYPVSAGFDAALKSSNQKVAISVVASDGTELAVVGGSVSMDSGREIGRTASLEIAPTDELSSDAIFDLVSTPGFELTIKRGVEWVESIDPVSASGGVVSNITVDNIPYRVHTFTASGTFTVQSEGQVEYLVVAGGGAGGRGDEFGSGGGGGGGGVVYGSTLLPSGPVSVVVGAGGTASTDVNLITNGGNSSFGTFGTAIGGGRGGSGQIGNTGQNGGSGGGGAGSFSTAVIAGGLGTAGQGNSGGSGVAGSGLERAGGGGGGGGAVGQNAVLSVPGNGGVGFVSTITGGSVYYAGGGGGGQRASGTLASGGLGGGGTGGRPNIQATNGLANTGGGGGGGGQNTVTVAGIGGNGGSGVVIIRYPLTPTRRVVRELVPLGVFSTDEAEQSKKSQATVRWSGSDRSKLISRNKFIDPYIIPSGSSLATAAGELLQSRFAGVEFDFGNVQDVIGAGLVFEAGSNSNPWQLARGLFSDFGYDLRFDGLGVARARVVPDPSSQNPVFDFGAGETNLVLDGNVKTRLDGIYNGVIASGEGSDVAAPVRAVVWDEDPTSPTYYLSGFGQVPYFFTSPLITTEDQARTAAQTILSKVKGRTRQLSWPAIVNPALEPLDVVRVDFWGSSAIYVIDQLSIPLSAGDQMSSTARETSVL